MREQSSEQSKGDGPVRRTALIVGIFLAVGLVQSGFVEGFLFGDPTLRAPRPSAAEVQEIRNTAAYVDPRLLTSNPSAYQGTPLYVQGLALNVEQHDSHTWVNLNAGVRGNDSTESIVVRLYPAAPSLLSEECYRFYGVGNGTTRVIRTFTGAEMDVPEVQAFARDPSEPRQFYGCEAP